MIQAHLKPQIDPERFCRISVDSTRTLNHDNSFKTVTETDKAWTNFLNFIDPMADLQIKNQSSYLVYLVTSAGLPRDHVAIFVEAHELGRGTGYQVSGNIQQGHVPQSSSR
jgi:hypothetical protein